MANRVLIITGNEADAKDLESVLGRARDGPFLVEWVTTLSAGIQRLRAGGVDAVMTDLFLADSQGIETFDNVFAAVSEIPILIICPLEDETLAIESVQRGAQGYLSKEHFGSFLVPQSLRNIIQRKAVEEAIFIDKARAEVTLNSISDAVIGVDMSGNVDYLNMAAEGLTGWSKEEARGHPIGEVMPVINGATSQLRQNPIELILRHSQPREMEADTILIRRDGQQVAIEDSVAPIYNLNGATTGAVIVFHDVTRAREMALKLAFQAQHDSLTNLPNRLLLNDRIAQAISQAERRGTHLAVLYLDLDNFKRINDSSGHTVGDRVLQTVAKRLRACVRRSDTVSRQGGDEFVVLISGYKQAEHAAFTAKKILAAIALPYNIGSGEVSLTTSIGISTYPVDAQNAETLIKNADTAMYQAKEKGRNVHQFFKTEMNAMIIDRQVVETNLRHALVREELVLYYQPKVNLNTGAITGSEALVRWIHPEWGMTLPGRFIPIAENCGMIAELGHWVLREACTQAKRWVDAGLEIGSVAVNISTLEFRNKDFMEDLCAVLKETGLEPRYLQLEITESVLMHEADSSSGILEKIQDMGVHLALDDFGTGYSSLSYLSRYPIDVLKIDQSFVQAIGSTRGSILVSAMIAMGASLKQRVVAEGIEDWSQLSFLKEMDCEEGQGFLFSRPVDAEQFTELLATGIPERVWKNVDGDFRPVQPIDQTEDQNVVIPFVVAKG